MTRAHIIVLALSTLPALAQPVRPDCASEAFALVAPLAGTWEEYEVTDNGEEPIGLLEVLVDREGCRASQRFVSHHGGLSFASFVELDGPDGTWLEHLVFSTGATATYAWRPTGDEIVFDRLDKAGTETKRLRATNVEPSAFLVLDERSADGGESWRTESSTWTRRIDPPDMTPVVTLPYCTPHGAFTVVLAGTEATADYAILPKGIVGTIEGTLRGRELVGRWTDPDGSGDIRVRLARDGASFSADYRADDDPEVWYRDWRGALRSPSTTVTFDQDGITYRCE